MKVQKDATTLVNKKKNALSITAQLLNLKNNKFKTAKNDFKNPKKAPLAKQKLKLALSELNLEGKPQDGKKINKGNQFMVGLSKSNSNTKKFNKPKQSKVNQQDKKKTAPKKTNDVTIKPKLPVANSSTINIKGNKPKQDSQQPGRLTSNNTFKPSKRKGWHHNIKSSKKTKVPKQTSSSLNPVGQERLDLNKVTTAVSGLLKLIEPKSQTTPDLLDLEEPIFMEVECIKIPQCPTKQLRFKLPHTLMSDMSDILLITTDLKGNKPNSEKAIDHYTELLKKHDITFIDRVMPLRMIRQDCSQYEVKQKLVDQFDMILVDAAVAKSMPKLLGQFVMFKKKMPIPVHLDRKDLKSHLEIARSKTQMTIKPNGHVSSVQVGHSKMSASEIAANIVEISKILPLEYPGGWNNVRSLQIRATDSKPVLVYVSFMSPNEVKPQFVQPKKRRAIVGEISTFPDKLVVVRPDGNVSLKELPNYKEPVDDSQDDEILKEAENYVQLSRTVRLDDDSDDENDKDADAITKAVENDILNKYEKNAVKSAKQRSGKDEPEEEEEDEDEESSDEEEAVLPLTGKKRKLKPAKKEPKGSSQGKKFKEAKKQHNFKGKPNGNSDQIQKRGSRGGKKNKVNKVQRKTQLKRKKAGMKS